MRKGAAAKKRRGREFLQAFHAEAGRIRAAGHHIRCLDVTVSHYRITNQEGGSIDFWGTTHTWTCPYEPTVRGRGVDALLDTLPMVTISPKESDDGDPVDLTTIFADGSWCPDTKAGGWGCWIKTANADSILQGGGLDGTVPSNVEAEARAMANALHLAVAHGRAPIGGAVLLQTDCLPVLGALMFLRRDITTSAALTHSVDVQRPRSLSQRMQEGGIKTLVDVIDRRRLRVIVRHVKGHKAGSGRAWVNQQCDRLAKKGMKERRAQIRLEENRP